MRFQLTCDCITGAATGGLCRKPAEIYLRRIKALPFWWRSFSDRSLCRGHYTTWFKNHPDYIEISKEEVIMRMALDG